MRFLFELGPLRLELTLWAKDEPELEELPFGFTAGSTLETEIVEE